MQQKSPFTYFAKKSKQSCCKADSISSLFGFAKNLANPVVKFTIIITVYLADCNILAQK